MSLFVPVLGTIDNTNIVAGPDGYFLISNNNEVIWILNPNFLNWFGDGFDGDVVIDSETIILERDMYYNNLTLSGTGILNTNGYRVYVKEILDISEAQSKAIHCNGGNGGNGGGIIDELPVIGSSGNFQPPNTLGGGGKAGAIPTSTGNPGQSLFAGNGGNGGNGAVSGDGIHSVVTDGGEGGITLNNNYNYRKWESNFIVPSIETFLDPYGYPYDVNSATCIGGGSGGGSAGKGTESLTYGGGAGAGAGVLWISANKIKRSNMVASIISAIGGNGGDGYYAEGIVGYEGAGGAGAGGGGWVYIAYYHLTGTTNINCIDVSGGNGGNGGHSADTGYPEDFIFGAAGGFGGGAGRITLINLYEQTAVDIKGTPESVAPTAPDGINGGVGGIGNILQINL